MLRNVCEKTVVVLTKNHQIMSDHSNVTSKNVSWYHFSWVTLYIIFGCTWMFIKILQAIACSLFSFY